jgi:hypothetical protein
MSSSPTRPNIATILLSIVWPMGPFARRKLSVLAAMRALFIATPIQWAMFLQVLVFVHEDKKDLPWLPFALGAVAVTDLLLLAKFTRRAPEGDSLVDLARWFRQVTSLGYALSAAPPLYGFVGYFLTGRLWVYLLGIPFGAAGLALSAPTNRRLAEYDSALRERGSTLRMTDAVMLPQSEVPAIKRRAK